LADRGHKVLVITGFPNYPTGSLYPGTHLCFWKWDTLDGIQILRLPLYPDHSRSAVRRVFNYGSFTISAAVLGSVLSGPLDVLFAEHPPLTIGLAAWFLGRVRRVPFLYKINDLWPESVEATGMVRNPVLLKWMGRLERFVYRRAGAIAVISPGFKKNLVGKGVVPDKVHVIPHWAEESLYRPVPPEDQLARDFGMTGRFNVVFAGQLGLAQGLDVVLDAAEKLSDLANVQFVLVGDGTDAGRLRRRVEEKGLGNVRFCGRQPAERMPYFFALADALLVHLKRDPLFEITIPGKTIAYLACGRPVLCAVAGDTAEVVRDAGAGLVCPPEDPIALAQAVRELCMMPRDQREAMGQMGRRAFLANYTRALSVDRYEKLLTQVAQQGK
jgi:glycosyltransferase involved in cell wall biosynthesis